MSKSIDLHNLSLAQLAELYNLTVDLTGDKPIKKFKDKPTGMARLASALEATKMEVFEPEPGDFDLRVASTEVDPTEDATPRRGGRTSPLLGRRLRVVRKENPKRAGTATHKRYELYSECTSSDAYMARCIEQKLGTRREVLSDLAWDSKQGFIKLS